MGAFEVGARLVLNASTYEGPTVAPAEPVSMGPAVEGPTAEKPKKRGGKGLQVLWDNDDPENERHPDTRELVNLVKDRGSIADDPAHGATRDGSG